MVMGQITENCDVVGAVDTKSVSHIDPSDYSKGIRVSFSLGDLCMNDEQQQGPMQPRQAIFDVECPSSGRNDAEFTVVPGNECIDQFTIKHNVGCGASSGIICQNSWLGGGLLFKLLKWTTLTVIVYMAGAYAWNRKREMQGTDAIPHYDLLCKAGKMGVALLGFTLAKSREVVGKLSPSGTGYNTV